MDLWIGAEPMEIDALKKEVMKLFVEQEPFTVQEICEKLDTDDDFHVLMAISELENEGSVRGAECLQVYREDGGAILLAQYRKV